MISKAMRFVGTLCASVLLAGCGATPSSVAQSGATPVIRTSDQRLAPGDSVVILVWRQPEFSGGFMVGGDGSLTHPLFHGVVVAGLPLDTARARLGALIEKYVQGPAYVIEPFFRVMVTGDVRAPGVYALPEQATLLDALVRAGGPNTDAKMSEVKLVRDGVVNNIDLDLLSNPAGHTLVLSGDEIVVPANRNILTSYVGPIASVVAALATLINVALR